MWRALKRAGQAQFLLGRHLLTPRSLTFVNAAISLQQQTLYIKRRDDRKPDALFGNRQTKRPAIPIHELYELIRRVTIDDLLQLFPIGRNQRKQGSEKRVLEIILGALEDTLLHLLRTKETGRDQPRPKLLVGKRQADGVYTPVSQVNAAMFLKILYLKNTALTPPRKKLEHAEERKVAYVSPQNHCDHSF
jgi:hypothetical protein